MKLFFVSDIHGSETCFRKLVNAGKFYGVDVLIMGGDLAGKELVPIVDDKARFRGSDFAFKNDGELQVIVRQRHGEVTSRLFPVRFVPMTGEAQARR